MSHASRKNSSRSISYDSMMYSEARLDGWPIFSLLDESFRNDIILALVFGSTGQESIIQLRNFDVYGLGANVCGCLGIGDENGIIEAQRIPELCGKRIMSISSGCGPHVVCALEDGSVYSWGHNGYSQLGTGNPSSCNSPGRVSCNLEDKRVIKISCGAHHTLVLTESGEVFSWGQNNCGQIGSGCSTNQTLPRKVTSCIGSKHVKDISCSQSMSLILLENGQVYAWGYNGNGQLGLGSTANQPNPTRISAFSDINVKKICCGMNHCLALSENGDVYAWGGNQFGQLGTGNKNNFMSPLKVNMKNEFKHLVDISASPFSSISAVMSSNGEVYIWGQLRGQVAVVTPMKTKLNCMDDVFALFSNPTVTYKPIIMSGEQRNNLSGVRSDLQKSFNDDETSDFTFIVEEKPIYVHKSILKIRCGYFRAMFRDGQWSEDTIIKKEVCDQSYKVYKSLLYYLYTDTIEQSLSIHELIELTDLANQYCEWSLKHLCASQLQKLICIENVASLYKVGVTYETKDLEDYALSFAFHHMTAITETDAFTSLDQSTLCKLISDVAVLGAFKH